MPIVQKNKPAKRQLTAEDILVAGLDALGEGFALFDSAQAFVCCNRPFVTLAGYPVGLCQPGDAEKNNDPRDNSSESHGHPGESPWVDTQQGL